MPNLRPLGCFLLLDFGVVLLLVLVHVVLVVTGVKQSQLLVPRLKSGLGTKSPMLEKCLVQDSMLPIFKQIMFLGNGC